MKRVVGTLGLALLCGIALSSGEALALVRVGGGVGFLGEGMGIAPLGRIAFDLLPLWFIAFSVDVEYWLLPDRGELLPFLTLSTTMIWRATVGAAPVLTISGEGLSVEWALKAGLGASLGPIGLFAETLFFLLGSELDLSGELRLAVGATLGF